MLKRKKPLLRRSGLKQSGSRLSVSRSAKTSVPDAADKLWSILRDRDIAGLRFRHRERVGPNLVDFLCPAARFIVQLEGDEPIDHMQTEWFRENGYRVLLLSQADVLGNPRRVLDVIAQAFEFRVVSRKNGPVPTFCHPANTAL